MLSARLPARALHDPAARGAGLVAGLSRRRHARPRTKASGCSRSTPTSRPRTATPSSSARSTDRRWRTTPRCAARCWSAWTAANTIRQRRLISAGFTPRMVARLEDQARRWAVSIVDRALERGTCNFVQDVAYQLPMHMIADIMGIPVEDRAWLFKLTTNFLQAGDPERRLRSRSSWRSRSRCSSTRRSSGGRKREKPAGRHLDDPLDRRDRHRRTASAPR